jgi:hypothetical protein
VKGGSRVGRGEQGAICKLFDEGYNDQNFDVLDELLAEAVVNHSATAEHKHGIDGFRHVMEWGPSSCPTAATT